MTMKALLVLLLAATVGCVPITSESETTQNCWSRGGSALSDACAADVGRRYSGESRTGVVSRGTLDCKALALYPDMNQFSFEFNVRSLEQIAACS
jgi:hypothetical protein